MKKHKIIVFVMLALIATLIMAVPGSARAVKEPFIEKSAVCAVLDPGTERVVADKIWQIRDRVTYRRTLPLDGGLPGTEGWNTAVVNVNINLQTGTGGAWGTWLREYDFIDGAYEGSFAGGFEDGVWYGRVTGKGTGVYEGYLVKGFQQDIPDPAMLPEGGDPCPPPGAFPGFPGAITWGYSINTNSD